MMGFSNGNKTDGKHYWLTPPELYKKLSKEFEFTFDPCPFPKPDDFDGLKVDWGESNYVNPPFGSIIDESGKKRGPTAWAKKAIEEYKKGKKVVLVYPVDKWILMLLEHAKEVRNLRDVKWCATEDGLPGKGTGRHIACFVLNKKINHSNSNDDTSEKIIADLRSKVARYREALEWYASVHLKTDEELDADIWEYEEAYERGNIAREALKGES